MSPILSVKELSVGFQTDDGFIPVLEDVSFTLDPGEILGIVGESGSGKTITSLSVLGLLPKPSGRITGGDILFSGKNLRTCSPNQMQGVRGREISMIFQEPMTALNPVKAVGSQIGEVFWLHYPKMSKQDIGMQVIELLTKVGITDAASRINAYPHQLSGGMRQRVMIAMALAANPAVLIADEPTTALDVTIQAQILQLIKDLQQQNKMAVIFVTHDLGVIAELCDRVVVMYAGEIVETAGINELFSRPKHPYSQGLLASIPRLYGEPKKRLNTIEGIVPSPSDFAIGCRFANRCGKRTISCDTKPPLEQVDETGWVRCFNWDAKYEK